jgi:hypothetical protein
MNTQPITLEFIADGHNRYRVFVHTYAILRNNWKIVRTENIVNGSVRYWWVHTGVGLSDAALSRYGLANVSPMLNS